MKKLFIFFSSLFILLSNLVIAQDIIVINDSKKITNIYQSVYYLNDIEGKLSLQDILQSENQSKFVQNTSLPLNTDMGVKSVWVKFSLQNNTGKELFLKLENIDIPEIEVYSPKAEKDSFEVKKMGIIYPYGNKEVFSRFFIIHLSDGKDTNVQTFYIRINQTIHHEIPLHISTAQNLLADSISIDVFFGIFFGMMLIMFVYNLYIYIVIREIGYLYYTTHIFASFFFSLVISGYGLLFFWSAYPSLNNIIGYTATFTTILIIIPFAASILETKKYTPRLHKGFKIFFGLLLLGCLASFFDLLLGFGLIQIILFILFIYIFIIGIFAYKSGNKIARFYILGNMSYLVGMIILFLKGGKVLSVNWFTMHANYLGTALEILFISFALADKIRYLNIEKQEAQKENLRLIEEQKQTLEQKVRERTTELENANTEITSQNEELQQQQEELLTVNEALEITFGELKNTSDRLNKSIQYAYNIQQIILPKKGKLDSFFSEHFSIYLPKDVVSGDFYWFTLLEDNKAIFVLADCTGHGVPGAFMSMIGGTLLHETIKIKGVTEPARILRNLNAGIRNVLKQEESQNSDGMDVSVCFFEKDEIKKEYKVTFAGAKSSVFYVKDSQVSQLVGDRITIGGSSKSNLEFTKQEVIFQRNDVIYFTSDGYIDQNNAERKRFGSTKFKELLSSIYQLPISDQEKIILDTLKEHQKSEEQRDDISVVGIRL